MPADLSPVTPLPPPPAPPGGSGPPGVGPPGVGPPPAVDSSLYERCFDGYRYRDQLVPQEFFWVSQLFGLFLGGVAIVVGFLRSVEWLAFVLVLLIGAAGAVMIWAFLCDMRANFRCKAALRWVMREIEDGALGDDVRGLYYWQIIHARNEIVSAPQRQGGAAVTNWFIRATWCYLVTWFILIVIVLVGLCVDSSIFTHKS